MITIMIRRMMMILIHMTFIWQLLLLLLMLFLLLPMIIMIIRVNEKTKNDNNKTESCQYQLSRKKTTTYEFKQETNKKKSQSHQQLLYLAFNSERYNNKQHMISDFSYRCCRGDPRALRVAEAARSSQRPRRCPPPSAGASLLGEEGKCNVTLYVFLVYLYV